jgi:hypothetical protein
MFSPGADMVDMQQSSADMMAAPTWGDAGKAAVGLGAATLGMAIPGTARGISEGVEGVADAVRPGIRAYHGSPHDFDRFSMDKIGTGEGAQVYGHGLYFADREDVARGYRDAVSGRQMGTGYANDIARSVLDANGGNHAVAAKQLRDELAEYGSQMSREQSAELDAAAAALEQGKDGFGHIYEVNINANPDDFLDWDKPLSEQSEKVARSLDQVVKSRDRMPAEWINHSPGAEGAMREAGIPGIRYLDQGSRTAGDGSRNYVVFDENLISILKKYGILGGIGIPAMGGVYGAGEERQ